MDELTHHLSVNKFGLTESLQPNDDSLVISPFKKYDNNLDDLENVEGFNNKGVKDSLYVFKLNSDGMYERHPITSGKEGGNPFSNTPNSGIVYNIVLDNGKLKLIKNKHDWDIDFRINNSSVSTKGENKIFHRLYNQGRIIGNFVSTKKFSETAVLSKVKINSQQNYYIGATKKKEGKTAFEFKT